LCFLSFVRKIQKIFIETQKDAFIDAA